MYTDLKMSQSLPKRGLIESIPTGASGLLDQQCHFTLAAGAIESGTIRSGIEGFMGLHMPNYKTESFSVPMKVVQFGDNLQMPLFTDEDAKKQPGNVQTHRHRVRGEQCEVAVFDFLKTSAEKSQMAAFKSIQLLGINKLFSRKDFNNQVR